METNRNYSRERIATNRGARYFDLNSVIHVVVYSKGDVIKLMPLKPYSMIEVWDRDEFEKQVILLRYFHIPHPPINRMNVSEHLLEFQFNIIGKTISDTLKHPEWRKEWKMNSKQKALFKSYAMAILKKVFRFNTLKARETYAFFDNEFGLLTS